MKFFRPEDFEMQKFSPKQAADFANGKIEREGKIAYANVHDLNFIWYEGTSRERDTHKALIIAVEKLCDHSKDKIELIVSGYYTSMMGSAETMHKFAPYYQCECGQKMEPSAFQCVP